MVLDVGNVLGLPANLCTRPVMVTGSVQHHIFRTHQYNSSSSNNSSKGLIINYQWMTQWHWTYNGSNNDKVNLHNASSRNLQRN